MSDDPRVIKPVASPESHIQAMKEVAEASKLQGLGQEKKIYADIKKVRMGHEAERNAAHMISHYAFSLQSTYGLVINDLRLVVEGVTAQIDHLLLANSGLVIVFETKSFSTGIKIDDDGQFWRWDEYKKRYIEIPSPVKQSERHIPVLRKALESIGYTPSHMGSVILVDYKARLIKPEKGFSTVCRPDGIADAVDGMIGRLGVWTTLKAAGKMLSKGRVSKADLVEKANALCKLHSPAVFNLWHHYGVKKPAPTSKTDNGDATPEEGRTVPSDPDTRKGHSVSNKGKETKPSKLKATGKSTSLAPPSTSTRDAAEKASPNKDSPASEQLDKLPSSSIAKKMKIKTEELHVLAEKAGLLEKTEKGYYVPTAAGKEAGVTSRKGRFGWYFLWPHSIDLGRQVTN